MTEEKKYDVKLNEVPVNVMIEETIKKIEELEQKGAVSVEEYVEVLEKVRELDNKLKEEEFLSFDIGKLRERLSKVEIIWHPVDEELAERILSLKDYDERLEKGINLLLEISKEPIGIALLASVEALSFSDLESLAEKVKSYVKKEDIDSELQKVEQSILAVKEVARELAEEKEKILQELSQTVKKVKTEIKKDIEEDIEVLGEKVRELDSRLKDTDDEIGEINERITKLTQTLNKRIQEVKEEFIKNVSDNEEIRILIKSVIAEEVERIKREIEENVKESIKKTVEQELKDLRIKDSKSYSKEEGRVYDTDYYEYEEEEYKEEDYQERSSVDETGEDEEDRESEKGEGKEERVAGEDKKTYYINLGLAALNVWLLIEFISSLLH